MAKRKESGIEVVASMPWPIGIALGLIGYLTIRYGIGWYLESTDNVYLSGLGRTAASGSFEMIGWMLLVGCWVAAVASFFGRARRRKLLDDQTGIGSLRQMSWQKFEQLTGEAFRRQEYQVEETGLGGADGGIDLILRRDGQKILVQCKQWRNRQIGVSIVREMYGVLMHEGADAVKIVALGDFTPDARRFARNKPIELIHGGELIATVRSLQATKARVKGRMFSPFALIGSMALALLFIDAVSSTAAISPSITLSPHIAAESADPQPATFNHSVSQAASPQSQHPNARLRQARAEIHLSDSRDEADLREWKKRNAESMKILEKTTKEIPLR